MVQRHFPRLKRTVTGHRFVDVLDFLTAGQQIVVIMGVAVTDDPIGMAAGNETHTASFDRNIA